MAKAATDDSGKTKIVTRIVNTSMQTMLALKGSHCQGRRCPTVNENVIEPS